MVLVSGLSLASHSDPESFLVVHTLFSQDGHQREGFWEVIGQVVSPFDLSRTLPVGGLLVPCSLPGPPVIKQRMRMLLWCLAPGGGGGFSRCASPNTSTTASSTAAIGVSSIVSPTLPTAPPHVVLKWLLCLFGPCTRLLCSQNWEWRGALSILPTAVFSPSS